MHREFRKLLTDAEGVTQFVIALNLDVRGFSSFCHKVESPSAAMFIRRVYMTLIDKYFNGAPFFKPTGDGLLVIIPYTRQNVKSVVGEIIETCLKAVQEFGTLCKGDPMINFETPQNIGIGLSRGPACRLFSGNKTLDYSGRVLNLASRLMDVARPCGVVFDDSLGFELLATKQQKLFAEDNIYLRGVAESSAVHIWYTKGITKISSIYRRRLDDIEWQHVKHTMKFRDIKDSPRVYHIDLPTKPANPKDIEIVMNTLNPKPSLRKKGEQLFSILDEFTYDLLSGKPGVFLDFANVKKIFAKSGVKDNFDVEIEISYSPK
jgi:class 3 adenylate cyclase